MYWSEIKPKESGAPECGRALIYTRQRILFENYETLDELGSRLRENEKEVELLEVHLFDGEKEYRCLSTRSKRFKQGWVETVVTFPEEGDTVYREEICLEDESGMITVLNHIRYDEGNGIAAIDNYRLVMGGKQ